MNDDPQPPIPEYSTPPKRRPKRDRPQKLLESIGGVVLYLVMLVIMVHVSWAVLNAWPVLYLISIAIVPLGSMFLLSCWFKSRVMMISVLITFGLVALTSGTCVVLLSGS
jgi:hypothetical protein